VLLKEHPQDFVSYFAPDAQFVRLRDGQMQTRAAGLRDQREMRADILAEVRRGERPFLINFEWQSSRDMKMDERLLGYSYEGTRLHNLAVLPCVIYTRPVASVPRAPLQRSIPLGIAPTDERVMLWFDYESLEVCKLSVAELRQRNLDGLRPLMLLCKDGASIAVLDEVLEALHKNDCREAIAVAIQFAGKVFTASEDIQHLERKRKMLKDILHESWTYQQIVSEGREEGKVIGAQENIEIIVQERFPELKAYVKECVAPLADKSQLQAVLLIVATAQTAEEVKQKLAALMQQ
jgi:hypothetical protein